MDIGDILIRLALLGVVVSGVMAYPGLRGKPVSPLAGWAFVVHAGALSIATLLMFSHFLSSRFEYAYVAQYSSRDLGPAMRVAASWAGQEGSVLLWLAIGALLGLGLLRQPGALARPALAFVALGQLSLMWLLMVRSPFVLNPVVPADGQGLNPLLEDPWMVVHPPVLFLGYAAMLVPFALALAALARREYRDWNRMAWPWSLFGSLTLGVGIALGGIWAYKTLGWGGFWGWDPVENASLIPWLVAVALLHGLMIQRVTGGLVRTNLILSALSWMTVVGGTYLTRSGVLADFSVHSFADAGLNTPLITSLVVFTLLPLVMIAARWTTIEDARTEAGSFTRESTLWLGMITILLLAGLVTVGTTAPILTAIGGKPGNVQPAFYHTIVMPLAFAAMLLMGLSPALRWFRQQGRTWVAPLVPGAIGAVILTAIAVVAGLRDAGNLALMVVSGFALGVNAAVAAQVFPRGWMYAASYVGHAGVAVMVIGMALSASLGKTDRLRLHQGEMVESLGYQVTLNGAEDGPKGVRTLDIEIRKGDWKMAARPTLVPSPQGEGTVRKPAISGVKEIYLAPTEVRAGGPGGEPVWLGRGEIAPHGGAEWRLENLRIEEQPEFRVFADLAVTRDGVTHRVSPGFTAHEHGRHETNATVPGLGDVSLAGADPDRMRAALVFPGDPGAMLALVEFSTKPFINLVWIGALITILGIAAAGIRRAGERTPLKDRRPQKPVAATGAAG